MIIDDVGDDGDDDEGEEEDDDNRVVHSSTWTIINELCLTNVKKPPV